MRELIKCLICGEQTKYPIDLFYRYHVKVNHPEYKSTKEYYDGLIRKENEGICECGKETKFDGYVRGYREYCSHRCKNNSPKYQDKLRQNALKNYQEHKEEIVSKSHKTSLSKYGSLSYSGTKECQEKVKQTSLDRYGIDSTLQLDHVREARINALEQNKEAINEKRKAFWTEENIQRVNCVRDKLVLEKYGVSNVSELDWVKEKIGNSNLETCQERYDVDNVMQLDWVKDNIDWESRGIKIRETNEQSGRWIPLSQLSEKERYWRLVKIETGKHIKELFKNWNGLDYYTNETLISNEEFQKNNPGKEINSNSLQPTIEHKTSIYYGFKNSIPANEIGNINNLVICGRVTNCMKNILCENEFKEVLNG